MHTTDEHQRVLIRATAVCRVIGLDVWTEDDVGLALQSDAPFPKVVLVNKTTYYQHFNDVSVKTP